MTLNFIGQWESETKDFKNIMFNEKNYEWGKDRGRWAINGDEIWLLTENSKYGTKWFYIFEEKNKLIFLDPEDFIYLVSGEYIYYQMTPPNTKVTFKRIP